MDEAALVRAWRNANNDIDQVTWFEKQTPTPAFFEALRKLQGWGRSVGIMGTGSRNSNLSDAQCLSQGVTALERLKLTESGSYGLVPDTALYVKARKALGRKPMQTSARDMPHRLFIEDGVKFGLYVDLLQEVLEVLDKIFPAELNTVQQEVPEAIVPAPAGTLQGVVDRGYLQYAMANSNHKH